MISIIRKKKKTPKQIESPSFWISFFRSMIQVNPFQQIRQLFPPEKTDYNNHCNDCSERDHQSIVPSSVKRAEQKTPTHSGNPADRGNQKKTSEIHA